MSFFRSGKARVLHALGRLRPVRAMGSRGNAAIEFALLAPIFAVILAGGIDLAVLIMSRFHLEATVSNSASYALVKADMVDAENSSDLAETMATMIASEDTTGETQASIVINNGAIADYDGAKISIHGTASRADACYCPDGTATSLDWGSERSCASSCPKGSEAGKYVVITVKQAYAPLFSSFGIIKDDSIQASAIVRTK
ncbi:MAG TPA: TadE/TadG family type IV pilus assembly protein [Sinorhizobium sp.]|nr:TadE/TadG family type IV pilus assembly protein [Sinorhizobium sp.]